LYKYLFLLTIIMYGATQAAEYPLRPIRLVVAYAPGGTTDFAARVSAPRLGELLGQTVVVDNRPGAGSILGTDLVANEPPAITRYRHGVASLPRNTYPRERSSNVAILLIALSINRS